jgi:hypothetical protein
MTKIPSIDFLTDWYQRWCVEQGLPSMSAQELLNEDGLTWRQQNIISHFLALWDNLDAQRGEAETAGSGTPRGGYAP